MKIVKCTNQLGNTKKEFKQISRFYKGRYIYTISANANIIQVKKEDTKTEFFEIEYFMIKD